MKKLLSFSLVVLASAFAGAFNAVDIPDTDGAIYDIVDDCAVLKGFQDGKKPVGRYTVPASISVTNTLGEVVITCPVKAIAPLAFANCRGLTEVDFQNSGTLDHPEAGTVEEIGDFAFSNCTALATVDFNYGLRSIGRAPFVNAVVSDVAFPETLMKLDGNIQAGCLNTLVIDIDEAESHFTMSDDGVLYNKDMTRLYSCPTRMEGTISIPSSVTTIGADAFFGCFRLSYLNIPSSVTTIESGAFNTRGIWDVSKAPESESKLQHVFFEGEPPMAEDDIFSGSPASLENYAFLNSWSEEAVAGEWRGRPLEILDESDPDNMPILSMKDSSTGITWYYRIVGGYAEIYNNGQCAISPRGTMGEKCVQTDDTTTLIDYALRIPLAINGYAVTKIGDHAFDGCKAITSVGIPSSVSEIGDYAFRGCSAVKGIDEYANVPFSYTTGALNLTYGISKVGRHAFDGMNLQTLHLPASVTELDGNVAAGMGNLTAIECDSPAFRVVDGILYNKQLTELLAVPASIDGTSLSLEPTVKTIGIEAFHGCIYLESVVLPDSTRMIGARAFTNCSSLVDIAIPSDVGTMGDGVFSACSKLKTVHFLGDAPTLTAWDCFYEGTPTNLVTWVKAGSKGWKDDTSALPDDGLWPASGARRSIKRPGENPSGGDPAEDDQPDEGESSGVMADADGVEWSYAVSDGLVTVTSVPTNTSGAVVVPSSIANFEVARIAEGAFDGCANITAIGIPESVATIAAGAFNGCTSLEAFEVDGANRKFKAVNGVLYTKDGKILLKVPAAFTFACESTMRRNEYSLQTQSVPMVSGSGYTTWKVETGRDSIETVKMSITPRVALSTLLRGVEEIADYALTDCGFVAQGQMLDGSVAVASNVVTTLSLKVNGKQIHAPIVNSQDVNQSFSGEVPAPIAVGFVHMATTNTVVDADSSWTDSNGRQYAASSATTTYLSLDGECSVPFIAPATVVKVGGHAFDGSGFTDVSCPGASTVAGVGMSLAAGVVLHGNAVADSAFTGEAAAVFDGWFVKDDGSVAGTVQVKASKKSRTGIKLTATVCPLAAKKITLKGVMGTEGVAVLKTTRGDHTLNVRLGVNVLSGSFDGMTVEGSLNAFARNPTAKKCWTVALETASATGAGAALARGYSGLSISTDAKGKAKVTGALADGTKVSVSAQLVEGEGVICVPVVMSLYAGKAGGLAFLLRIDAKTGAASVSGVSKWTAPGRSSFTATLNGGIRVGVAGTKPAGENITFAGELPDGYSLGVDDPWKGWRPKTTLKTGVLKGTITLYTATNGRMKAVKATVSGVVVDGVGYASAIVKNVASVPMTIHR